MPANHSIMPAILAFLLTCPGLAVALSSRIRFGPLRESNLAHLDSPGNEKIRGWTGGRKWNYSKNSAEGMRPERRFKDWRESMACTEEWCGRRSPAQSLLKERGPIGTGRSWLR